MDKSTLVRVSARRLFFTKKVTRDIGSIDVCVGPHRIQLTLPNLENFPDLLASCKKRIPKKFSIKVEHGKLHIEEDTLWNLNHDFRALDKGNRERWRWRCWVGGLRARRLKARHPLSLPTPRAGSPWSRCRSPDRWPAVVSMRCGHGRIPADLGGAVGPRTDINQLHDLFHQAVKGDRLIDLIHGAISWPSARLAAGGRCRSTAWAHPTAICARCSGGRSNVRVAALATCPFGCSQSAPRPTAGLN